MTELSNSITISLYAFFFLTLKRETELWKPKRKRQAQGTGIVIRIACGLPTADRSSITDLPLIVVHGLCAEAAILVDNLFC